MNRFNDMAVSNCAKSAISRFGPMWNVVSDEVRDAFLDSAIMDSIRLAESVDGSFAFSASDVVAFRARVIAALDAGVFVGRSKHGLRFDRVREERRVMAAYEQGVGDGKRGCKS